MSSDIKIEAVITCVGYAHYLAFTYPYNRHVFDHYIVVTSARDTDTQAFCFANNITCVITESMYHPNAVFDRGLANNEGFKALRYHNWVVHLDVDIALPKNFRGRLPDLDTQNMYGARRVILERLSDFYSYTKGGKTVADFEYPEGCGFGYFQMFNWQSAVIKGAKYGTWYPSAANVGESDWQFRNLWGKSLGGGGCDGNLRELPFPVMHLGAHGNDSQNRRFDTFFSETTRVRDNKGDYIMENQQ